MTPRGTARGLRPYILTALLAFFFVLLALSGYRLILTICEMAGGNSPLAESASEQAAYEPTVPDYAERTVLVSTDRTTSILYRFDGCELYYTRSKNKPANAAEGDFTAIIGELEATVLLGDGTSRISFEADGEYYVLVGNMGVVEMCEIIQNSAMLRKAKLDKSDEVLL